MWAGGIDDVLEIELFEHLLHNTLKTRLDPSRGYIDKGDFERHHLM